MHPLRRDEIKYIGCLLQCNKQRCFSHTKRLRRDLLPPPGALKFAKKMECTVSWTGSVGGGSSMGFIAETGSGHVITMDGAPDAAKPENGGRNLAPRPMETVLAGTGGCTAYDVVLILKRGRHQVERCSVKLTSARAEKDPKVFTKIHLHFTVAGKNIPEAAVERAIALSHETYCSATIMLAKTAVVTTSFELINL